MPLIPPAQPALSPTLALNLREGCRMRASTMRQPAESQFARNAEQYARSAVFAQGDNLSALLRVVNLQPHWQTLDVATGGGHTAIACATRARHVTATDIVPQMLAAASRLAHERGLTNIDFTLADAESLPHPDGTFDLVTCRIAPHHFNDPGRAVREMARVCKSGALAAVIDGIAPPDRAVADEINRWEAERDPSHVALLTINGWSALFCAAGLDAVHLSTFNLWLDFDEHMRRAGVDHQTAARLRRQLLDCSPAMREWLKVTAEGDTITFNWPLALIVGRKPASG